MDLKEFYFNNIQEEEYHYRFYDSIKDVNKIYNVFSGYEEVNDYEFEVYDAEEAITKFRELCQPEVSFSSSENKCWFYLVTYYYIMETFLFLGLGTSEILLIVFIVLLLFGGRKIPELMRGLGKGIRNFKEGMNGVEKDADVADQSSGSTDIKKK